VDLLTYIFDYCKVGPMKRVLLMRALITLILVAILSGCGSSEKALSPEEASAKACQKTKLFADSYLEDKKAEAAEYARVASLEFFEITSVDPRFSDFAEVLRYASNNNGSVGLEGLSAYSSMLTFCKDVFVRE